jgi:hypothetical protein
MADGRTVLRANTTVPSGRISRFDGPRAVQPLGIGPTPRSHRGGSSSGTVRSVPPSTPLSCDKDWSVARFGRIDRSVGRSPCALRSDRPTQRSARRCRVGPVISAPASCWGRARRAGTLAAGHDRRNAGGRAGSGLRRWPRPWATTSAPPALSIGPLRRSHSVPRVIGVHPGAGRSARPRRDPLARRLVPDRRLSFDVRILGRTLGRGGARPRLLRHQGQPGPGNRPEPARPDAREQAGWSGRRPSLTVG